MSMMDTEQQGIVILEEDAKEAEPCDVLPGCSREAVFLVTFIFPEGHSCTADSRRAARLCLAHTDYAKELFTSGTMVCTECNTLVIDLIIEPIRRP